jgi:hypothetical protein
MKLITMSELDELKAVREAATPGPWESSVQSADENYIVKRNKQNEITHYVCEGALDRDRPYIAKVNPEFVSRLEGTLRRAIEVIDELCKHAQGQILGANFMVKQADGSTRREWVEFEIGKSVKRSQEFLASVKSGDV